MQLRNAARNQKSEISDENSENKHQRREENPFEAAVEVTHSLFSVQQVPLGVEHSLETGPRPCGLWVTDERARFVRRGVTEMLNSRGEWESTSPAKNATLGVALIRENDRWRRALTLPRMLEGSSGNLCRLRSPNRYGREVPVARILTWGDIALVKCLRKAIRGREENAELRTLLCEARYAGL